MKTYISLLRGINVSGQKKILMSDLKSFYENMGFTRVQTYIQSGNLIFEYDGTRTNDYLSNQIEQEILQRYGYEVAVFVLALEELEAINSLFPFGNVPDLVPKTTFVTLFKTLPTQEKIQALSEIDISPDRYEIMGKVMFWYCVNTQSSKLSNNYFEGKLQVIGTSRNWKTMNQLVLLARNFDL
ncbi:MAG: DUF1697 domain-containing protein [Cytophagales bacterium]|nr:DUF1697 domain-containing protein [Cytophagales bacterium]